MESSRLRETGRIAEVESARRDELTDSGKASSNRQEMQVVVRATYWEACQDMDVTEWILQGRRLGSIGRAVAWWIGDWVNYGNARFGEKYARATRITGYDVQSLMNMAYVSARFSFSRRREKLSWSHHAELAALDLDLQDKWLDRAESMSLSVRGLREELRTWRANRHELSDSGSKEDEAQPEAKRVKGETVCPKCGFHITSEEEPQK